MAVTPAMPMAMMTPATAMAATPTYVLDRALRGAHRPQAVEGGAGCRACVRHAESQDSCRHGTCKCKSQRTSHFMLLGCGFRRMKYLRPAPLSPAWRQTRAVHLGQRTACTRCYERSRSTYERPVNAGLFFTQTSQPASMASLSSVLRAGLPDAAIGLMRIAVILLRLLRRISKR